MTTRSGSDGTPVIQSNGAMYCPTTTMYHTLYETLGETKGITNLYRVANTDYNGKDTEEITEDYLVNTWWPQVRRGETPDRLAHPDGLKPCGYASVIRAHVSMYGGPPPYCENSLWDNTYILEDGKVYLTKVTHTYYDGRDIEHRTKTLIE